MISHFLAIIDKLIKLKEYRDKRLQKIFEQLLEPVFNDLLIVHADYLDMFERIWMRLAELPRKGRLDYNERILEIENYLRHRRREYEPVRIKLRSMLLELESLRLTPEIDGFVDAVVQYFPKRDRLLTKPNKWRAIFYVPRSPSAALLKILNRFEKKQPISDSDKKYFARCCSDTKKHVSYTLKKCRQNWSAVCEAYARLKFAVIKR